MQTSLLAWPSKTVVEPAQAAVAVDTQSDVTEESWEFPFTERLDGDSDNASTDISSDAVSEFRYEVDDNTTLLELIQMKHRPQTKKIATDLEHWVHRQSMVDHLCVKRSTRFLCGRLKNQNYELKRGIPTTECPSRTTCFGNHLAAPERRD